MVTVQDIGSQLTRPVRELAQWNFPFSQTLEQYCSLFDKTCNKSFSEAGLVLQNSTAVYVHRVDSLWTQIEYCRNVLSTHEQEESTKSPNKKRDKKTDVCSHKFTTVNFAEEVDKNIDIKKNHVAHEAHDSVKSKSRRFTQLEKGIAQHVSIDIYDVNRELIGKKYDFRCNQNISMDGILVDEFAPQDFCCSNGVSVKDISSSNCSNALSCDTSAFDSAIHDDNNESVINTYAEFERDDESPEEGISDLVTSLNSGQQNLSLSGDIETENTLVETSTNILSDSICDVTLVNSLNETCPDALTDRNSPMSTNIDSAISSNNNNSEDQCLNNNLKGSIDVGSLLDSPPESVNSKERRTSSTDDSTLVNDTNGDLAEARSFINSTQNTSLNDNKRSKTQQSSILKRKTSSKTLKRKLPASRKSVRTKRNLNVLEDALCSHKDRPNMFNKRSSSCMKYIREYNPSQYENVTNAELDLLGFRLHVNTKPVSRINKDVAASINDNAATSIDEEISEPRSPSPVNMSSPHENFCDVWFRSDSPHFLSETVDKWHEMIQPKLRDAEKRSTFQIRDYASRIMTTLKESGQRKINFDTIIQKEHPCEVARYFLASLDLASKQNVDINTNEDPEHDIEIALHEVDSQFSTNSQAVSHD